MPASFERKRKRRGTKRWWSKRVHGHLIRGVVTKKKGPRGGKTVGYKVY